MTQDTSSLNCTGRGLGPAVDINELTMITQCKAREITSKLTFDCAFLYLVQDLNLKVFFIDGFLQQSDWMHKACKNDEFNSWRTLPALKIPSSFIFCGTGATYLEQAPCIRLCKLYDAPATWTGTWERITDWKTSRSQTPAAIWSGSCQGLTRLRSYLSYELNTAEKEVQESNAYPQQLLPDITTKAQGKYLKLSATSFDMHEHSIDNSTSALDCLRSTNLRLLLLVSCSTKTLSSSTEQSPQSSSMLLKARCISHTAKM